MATQPVLSGPPVIAAGPSGGRANVGAFMAPGEGSKSIASAIGQAGQAIGEFGERLQYAKDRAAIADADRQMKQLFEDYQRELQTNPDEETWTAGYAERSSKLRNELLATRGLSKPARDALTERVKDWEQESASRISTAAKMQSVKLQAAKFEGSADFMFERGQFAEGEEYLKQALEVGVINRERYTQQVEVGKKKTDIYAINQHMSEDPVDALEALEAKDSEGNYVNFDAINANDRLALKREAEQRIATVHERTMRGHYEKIYLNAPVDPKDIDRDVASNKLTPLQGARIKKDALAGGVGVNGSVELAADLAERTTRLGEVPHAQRTREYYRLMAESSRLPPKMAEDVQDKLKKAFNNDASFQRVRDVRATIERMKQANAFGYAATYTAAEADRYNQDNKLKPESANYVREGQPKNQPQFMAASETTLRLYDFIDRFVQERPLATSQEIMAAAMKEAGTQVTAFAVGGILDARTGKPTK